MSTSLAAPPGGVIPANGNGETRSHASFWALTVGSVGVVYGDIGTSPLYAFREAVTAASAGGTLTRDAVLGVLSLILWALIVVVTLKYVLILLRADNKGEGGTLALMALAQRALGKSAGAVVLCGIISAALFYGDAMHHAGAVGAVRDRRPQARHPRLRSLHRAADRRDPGRVVRRAITRHRQGRGVLRSDHRGVVHRHRHPRHSGSSPAIPRSCSPSIPVYAVTFLASHGVIGLITLGAVFLAVTGAEALYADLGHFGKRPIQIAWVGLVLPSLAVNYLGQGALVLADPKAIENPFFLLYPAWALLPMVVLATAATVIASQAVITGAYSISQQAIQLGLLPRLEIRHTSQEHYGQIFMPRVNLFLLVGVLFLVLMFRSSSALASAYGIAVTGTMVVTGIMAFVVIWKVWHWSPLAAAALMVPFLLIDLTFLGANMLKVHDGGWVPLALAAAVMVVMYTWRRGSRLLFEKTRRQEISLDELVRMLEKKPPTRVPGTAVFLTSTPNSAPTALMHSLKHYKVLHEHNVILTIETADTPRVPSAERVRMEQASETFTRVTLRFGFMETPNVPKALAIARKHGWQFDIMSTSFFLSRRSLKPAAQSGMPYWQDRLFIMLTRIANDATDYFQIPTGRVVEVGTQVTI